MLEDNVTVDVVHHRLKGHRWISKAEVHDYWFEEAVFCFKGGFVFIAFMDSYVVVSPLYIQFHVDVCVAQIMYEVGNEGKQVLVTYSESIDFSVILYGP